MKGILFKEKLFNQIRLGNKRETRRLVKCPKKNNKDFTLNLSHHNGYENFNTKPRYKKGEIVYLKEPYELFPDHKTGGDFVDYAFDLSSNDQYRKSRKWKNKLFMPESAARYFIKIDDVRLEYLKDITPSSIRREGLVCPKELDDLDCNYWYIDEWIKLWNQINGKNHPWKSNPIVWVYDFSLTDETILKINSEEHLNGVFF